LKKSLKFGIKNKKIDTYEILARFEELAQSLDWIQMKNTRNDPLKANLNDKNVFLQKLQQMAFEFIELSKLGMVIYFTLPFKVNNEFFGLKPLELINITITRSLNVK
jgi:hypothetical protein